MKYINILTVLILLIMGFNEIYNTKPAKGGRIDIKAFAQQYFGQYHYVYEFGTTSNSHEVTSFEVLQRQLTRSAMRKIEAEMQQNGWHKISSYQTSIFCLDKKNRVEMLNPDYLKAFDHDEDQVMYQKVIFHYSRVGIDACIRYFESVKA